MIGVIADDLTGAAELGAVGRRLGFKAEIVFNHKPSNTADLVCVDTDSRLRTATEAAKRAVAAAKLLQSAGARWIYKKVDSVLRGNVTAELEAILQHLGLTRALLLPANPSLGRIIRDGQYFVRGKPIHHTEFANDPEYPRRGAQVLRMVEAPKHFLLKVADGRLEVPENTILIGQADSSAAVRAWAGLRGDSLLRAGGAEFFGALLTTESHSATPSVGQEFEFGEHRQLFVCGTVSKSGRDFFRAARKARVPVFTLPRELTQGNNFSPDALRALARRAVEAFDESRRVMLGVGLPRVRDARTARRLSGYLVDVAEVVLRRAEIKYVFAEGGATSAELVRRMKWPRLEVVREWTPGVATLAVADEYPRWLTIKPGSYSWPPAWTPAE